MDKKLPVILQRSRHAAINIAKMHQQVFHVLAVIYYHTQKNLATD